MLFPSTNIFVDGGGHSCSGIENYLPKIGNFNKVYVFEPNPVFHESYDNRFKLIKKAIWTADCKMPFYLSKDDRQVSSSLLSNKLCKVNSKLVPFSHEDSIEVECVDFSHWLKNNINPKS